VPSSVIPPDADVVVEDELVEELSDELEPDPPQPASASVASATTTNPANAGRFLLSILLLTSSDDTRTRTAHARTTVTAVDVLKLGPGLWRWTAYHEEWRQEVGCVYHETPDGVVLVDPLVPGDEEARFWKALDRDVKRAGSPVHVLVTVFWHARSSREIVERYGARLWSHPGQLRRIKNRAGEPSDVFEIGDRLPGDVKAFDTGRSGEVLFWLPRHRALVAGDVLLGSPLRLCPKSWLPRDLTREQLAQNLRPLLDLPVVRVIVSHGEPVLRGGRKALAAALEL
jgi:glyoxylase-like metal-dependent hydrolase (beta-lactamase superfamily II)